MGAVPSRVLHRRLAVSLAVLGAAAAFAPQAVADDGPVAVPAAAADALALAEAALTPTTPPATTEETASTSQEDVEEAAPAKAEPTLPDIDELVTELAEAPTVPDAQAPAPEAHSAPATPAEAPVPSPEAPAPAPAAPAPAAEAPVQASQAPANSVQTSIPAPVAEPVRAVAQQLQPVNVNISLRFESPGDNGPVNQVNAAVAGVVAEFSQAPEPETQYQPQYQAPPEPAGNTPAPEAPPASENQAPPTSAPAEQWDWNWQWGCGDAIPAEIAIPGNSLLPIWNWNWEWNCGGNPDTAGNSETQLPSQYHAAATQYQPINLNISIRISSPGNDGPVTQTNIAQTNVAVTVHAGMPALPPLLTVPVVNPAPVTTPSSGGGAPAASAPQAVSSSESLSLIDAIVGAGTVLGVLPVELAVELECCTATTTPSRRRAVDDGRLRRPEIAGLLGTGDEDPSAGPVRGDTARATAATAPVAPVSAEAIASLAPPQPAVDAAQRAKAQERLKRSAHKAAPKDERADALSQAGVSPLAAPDKTSKLFFLYLIPFALAFVDAARRFLGEQSPTAADPGRPQERPG